MELFPEFVSLRPPSGELKALDTPLYQIAPGVWVSGMPAFEMPSHVLCRIVPVSASPGQFTLAPEGSYPGYVRMSDDLGERLGILGLSSTTMRRLLAAGFVDHIRPAPGCIFISIESLLAHFARTANDCEQDASYWTAKRREAWKETFESTNNFED
jgi:hypothetical protein